MDLPLGRYRLRIFQESRFRLDGGAMFGIVPKPLWSRQTPADARNRIELAANCVLIEGEGRTVLIEAGCGRKWDEKARDIYAIQHPRGGLREQLAAFGVERPDAIVLTHLHFDHAGGLTEPGDDGEPIPTFPDTPVFVQQGNLDEALAPHALNRGSYLPDNLGPLQASGLIEAVSGDVELFPGLHVEVSGGHAGGHQLVHIESGGQHALFLGDLVPTWAHLAPAWIMGYDLYRTESLAKKTAVLDRAFSGGWLLISCHDPGQPMGRLGRDERGRYTIDPA